MKTKPWPLMILALANFFCPIGNVVLSARLEGISILQYLHSTSLMDFIPILLAPWIGAFAIFSVKKWSYPVFLTVMAYQTGDLFYQAHLFPEILNVRLVFFISLLNFSLVSYFLSPKVRHVYYDQRLKWWESSPRYEISAECLIGGDEGKDCKAQVKNISIGGAFLTCSKELQVDHQVELAFEVDQDIVFMVGKVLYFRNGGFGIQFTHDKASEVKMKALIKHLIKDNGSKPLNKISKMEDFRKWAKTEAFKPKGWLPEANVEKLLEDEKIEAEKKKAA
jgi:hypothetical protein